MKEVECDLCWMRPVGSSEPTAEEKNPAGELGVVQ